MDNKSKGMYSIIKPLKKKGRYWIIKDFLKVPSLQ